MSEPETRDTTMDDSEALDFLIAAQFDPDSIGRMPEHLRASAQRLLGDLQTIHAYPSPMPSDVLVHATLARIAQSQRSTETRMSINQERPSLRVRMGIPNFVAIAAMLVVAAGVAIPLSHQVRQSQGQLMCASGLRGLGSGISAYAADNNGIMPMTAGLGSFLADQPAQTSDSSVLENAKHLDLLSTKGYCDHKCTRCNGARNLSYRVPLHVSQINMATMARSPIAADANPVQSLVLRGIIPLTCKIASDNHGQRGQNVLYSDGSAPWMVSPILQAGPSGVPDNIWVIRGIDGRESTVPRVRAATAREIFLSN
ncbi:MAG: hypothetical protein EXS15_05070 [Phycisphaerales bacterium]|nr:hypothetical protein [Phycisphaerales bacterium]